MDFAFDQEKNELLFRLRGVTFPMVIEAIADKGILYNFDHPNQERYPGQKVLVVDLNGYAYCVPYVVKGDTWFLKTIYPSRRFKHLVQGDTNG
jgi:hypothetical protein